MSETFGERVKRLRSTLGLTAAELAYSVGITEGAVRQIEAGVVKSVTLFNGVKLARNLGVDPAYLAFGESSAGEMPGGDPITLRLQRLEEAVLEIRDERKALARVLLAFRDALRTLATVTKTDLPLQELDRQVEGQ